MVLPVSPKVGLGNCPMLTSDVFPLVRRINRKNNKHLKSCCLKVSRQFQQLTHKIAALLAFFLKCFLKQICQRSNFLSVMDLTLTFS